MRALWSRTGSVNYLLAAALTAVVAVSVDSCEPQSGGDLTILPNASEFRVAFWDQQGGDIYQTVYELKLTVANFSVDAEGGNIADFAVSCEMFSADALGGKLASHSKRTVPGLSVNAFNTTEAFLRFKFQKFVAIAGHVVIDCTVDPEDNVVEILEDNNESSFFFRAYCIGNECPGPIQTGPRSA
jgi:hypothetical protein